MSEQLLKQEVVIQGRSHWCPVPRTVCSACGVNFSTVSQANKAIELGVAAFQAENNLLTAAAIKEKREELELTQRQLADRANVGIASVKRWESGRQVQTAANDQALRNTFSQRQEDCDLDFTEVTYTRFYMTVELRSFSKDQPANPMVKTVKSSPLRTQTTEWGISDHPFNEPSYA